MVPLRIFLIAALLSVVFSANVDADKEPVWSFAPDFTLNDTEGRTFNLSDYEDEKVVILFFMYTTCPPCEKFVGDALEPYSKIMDNDDVVILSISVFGFDSESDLADMANDYGWIHAMGDPNGDIEIAYDVQGTPKLFIIDKDGKITYTAGGTTTAKSVPHNPEELELEVYNATLTDEEETEGEGKWLIPALISIGLIAIYRRK